MPAPEAGPTSVLDFGCLPYREALELQETKLEEVAAGHPGYFLIGTHPPVVTLGRKSTAEDLRGWLGDTIEVSRGGRATYHGPSQLIAYPIVPVKDVALHLRRLEHVIVRTLARHGIQGTVAPEVDPRALEDLSLTGVWVGSKKIASIGIALRKWVAYHGLALNLHKDTQGFEQIQPCGFSPQIMTSVEEVTGTVANFETWKSDLIKELIDDWNPSKDQEDHHAR